jgi:maleate cis-trans isomerase
VRTLPRYVVVAVPSDAAYDHIITAYLRLFDVEPLWYRLPRYKGIVDLAAMKQLMLEAPGEIVEAYDRTSEVLPDDSPIVVLWACTAASFVLGADGETQLRRTAEGDIRLREIARREETGKPPREVRVITMTGAMISMLRAVRAQRVASLTPYVDEVDDRYRRVLEAHRFQVVRHASLGRDQGIRSLAPDEVAARAISLARNRDLNTDVDAIAIPCSNVETTPEMLADIKKKTGAHVVTANAAAAIAAAAEVGAQLKVPADSWADDLVRKRYGGVIDISLS